MRILILADANAAHSIKWIEELTNRRIEMKIFSLQTPNFDLYSDNVNRNDFISVAFKDESKAVEGSLGKLEYLSSLKILKRILSEFQPQIIHAHYATSYGLLGALLNFHPFVISVWGSDVMSFPGKSYLHKQILKFNFSKAVLITASSNYLRMITSQYTSRNVEVVPFGIDLNRFRPDNPKKSRDGFVIGTVKGLEDYYGIGTIIQAFNLLVQNDDNAGLKLIIAGDGSQKEKFINLVNQFGIQENVKFLGNYPYSKIQELYNSFDICVFASTRESFGVAVLEAQACGIPVLVSDIDGFKEVYKDGKTALSFRAGDAWDLAEKIKLLMSDDHLRRELSQNAPGFVFSNFNLSKNADSMLQLYKQIIKG